MNFVSIRLFEAACCLHLNSDKSNSREVEALWCLSCWVARPSLCMLPIITTPPELQDASREPSCVWTRYSLFSNLRPLPWCWLKTLAPRGVTPCVWGAWCPSSDSSGCFLRTSSLSSTPSPAPPGAQTVHVWLPVLFSCFCFLFLFIYPGDWVLSLPSGPGGIPPRGLLGDGPNDPRGGTLLSVTGEVIDPK